MRDLVKRTIVDAIKEFNEDTDIPVDLSEGEETRLFGGSGVLTSVNLVSLVVMVEEAVEKRFGLTVTLADEKAMSRRVSPFASLGTLIDYVSELVIQQRG